MIFHLLSVFHLTCFTSSPNINVNVHINIKVNSFPLMSQVQKIMMMKNMNFFSRVGFFLDDLALNDMTWILSADMLIETRMIYDKLLISMKKVTYLLT